jgi:type II secretory pathway component PulF
MTTYLYKAKTGLAKTVTGLLEAETRTDALEKLSGQGYFPFELKPYAEPDGIRTRMIPSISKKDLAFFTRQMADLLDADVALPRALSLTHEQAANPALRRLIDSIRNAVQGGAALSEALRANPRVFPPLYVNLIHAGETGGMLSQTLNRLAAFMEQEEEFRSRLWAALAYPLLILAVGGLTVLFLMMFVVPRLSAMFLDSEQGMPWMARILSGASAALTSGKAELALAIPAGFIAWQVYRAPDRIRTGIERAVFHLPLWGPVLTKSMIARFARTLSMLLAGGVPALPALKVAAGILEHPEFRRQALVVTQSVEQGDVLSESLRGTGLFPAFVCQMIAIGEETNSLERALDKIAATYERETDRAMKLAVALLEPAMILAVGSVIGVIVIAMLLPIFEISTYLK